MTSPAANEFAGESVVLEGSGEYIKQIVAYGRPVAAARAYLSLTGTNRSSIIPSRYNSDRSPRQHLAGIFVFWLFF